MTPSFLVHGARLHERVENYPADVNASLPVSEVSGSDTMEVVERSVVLLVLCSVRSVNGRGAERFERFACWRQCLVAMDVWTVLT